jgi:prevent-host-death family protein
MRARLLSERQEQAHVRRETQRSTRGLPRQWAWMPRGARRPRAWPLRRARLRLRCSSFDCPPSSRSNSVSVDVPHEETFACTHVLRVLGRHGQRLHACPFVGGIGVHEIRDVRNLHALLVGQPIDHDEYVDIALFVGRTACMRAVENHIAQPRPEVRLERTAQPAERARRKRAHRGGHARAKVPTAPEARKHAGLRGRSAAFSDVGSEFSWSPTGDLRGRERWTTRSGAAYPAGLREMARTASAMTMSGRKARWSVASAKAELSRVVESAQRAPQIIERRGKAVAVVVGLEQFRDVEGLARWRRFLAVSEDVRTAGGARLRAAPPAAATVAVRRDLMPVDTNVLSELPCPRPNPDVLRWFAAQETIRLSVVTLEELAFGLARATSVSCARLARWFDALLESRPALLHVTPSIARASGELRTPREARERRVAQAHRCHCPRARLDARHAQQA